MGRVLLSPPGQLADVRFDALAQLPCRGLRSLHHPLGMLLAVAKQALALVEELLGPDHLLGQGEPDPIHQLHQLLVVDHHAAAERDPPRLREQGIQGVEQIQRGRGQLVRRSTAHPGFPRRRWRASAIAGGTNPLMSPPSRQTSFTRLDDM